MSSPGLPDTVGGPCGVSRGGNILGVEGTFLFIATVSVSLRVFVRTRMLREPGLDDAAVVIAVV